MQSEADLLLLSQEEFAQREPLTTRLRGLVRSYPKGVGLVQEFVQNADDAGAGKVHVILDKRSHNCSKLPSPSMSELQGPAFVVVNDAQFSPEDWNNIQQIGDSGKALQTTKTGRFGLGFNSVYNVTDFPMLLTGTRLGVFDPHGQTVYGASVAKPGNAWRLTEALWSQCSDMLLPFQLFGLGINAPEFDGTVFRLPIRTEARAPKSEICQQPFTDSDFYSIVDKLNHALPDLLLFLRNLHKIEISVVDESGRLKHLLSAETVNREAVDLARERIREALSLPHDRLFALLSTQSSQPVVSEYDHHIDVSFQNGVTSRIVYRVVSGLFGDATGELAACSRKMQALNEKAVPLAGAAARVDGTRDEFFSPRLFCTLPLPSASPLAFCHLNGFFDLQADRQGLFQDLGSEGSSALRVTWNHLLLKHCCSEVAARLCHHLTERALAAGRDVYDHWPRVSDKEQALTDSLARHVYERLSLRSCVPAGGSSAWKPAKDVLVPTSKLSDELKCALLCDSFPIPNPQMPSFVISGFKAAKVALSSLDPSALRRELKTTLPIEEWELASAPRPCLQKSEWIRAMLEYCTADGQFDDLVAVPLALAADGKLRVFGKSKNLFLGGEEERSLLNRRPEWFIDLSLENALGRKESARAKVFKMTPANLLLNVHNVLPKIEPDGKASSSDNSAPTEQWLANLFEYFAAHSKELSMSKDLIRKLPVVPDQYGYLHGMGSANTPLLPSSDDPKPFIAALTHLGVPLVTGNDSLMKAIRKFCEQFQDTAIWRLTPGDLIDTLHAVSGTGASSSTIPSLKQAAAVLDFLSSPRSVKDLRTSTERVKKLRALRLFATATSEVVSLDSCERFIPADYDLPRFAADVGLLATGKEDRWVQLYQALNVQKLTRARLINSVILPRLHDLTSSDSLALLAWLRTNLHAIREEEDSSSAAALLSKLKSVLPVQCTDGSTRPPCLLYHPESSFASSLLGDRIGFPDLGVYRDRPDLWLEFFETLGMERLLRPEDIIGAIDDLTASDLNDDDKADRLVKIAEYCDQYWEQLKVKAVSVAASGKISFCEALAQRSWLPALTRPPREFPANLVLNSGTTLFAPSDLLPRAALALASSVRPVCRTNRIPSMQSDLGVPSGPDLGTVLDQLANLSELVRIDEIQMSDKVAGIFTDIYSFLGRQFADTSYEQLNEDETVIQARERFKQISCILDSNFKLWQPGLCFGDSVGDFLGLRARVRSESKDIDRGLFLLGRRDRPEASDYLSFFYELIQRHESAPIPEDNRATLRSAYLNAALLAKSNEFRGCPILLQTGVLSREKAVFDNAPWLSERAVRGGVAFVDSNLQEIVIRQCGISLLSSAVYEKPIDEYPSLKTDFISLCAELEHRLRAAEFHRGVCRLVRAAGGIATTGAIASFFANIGVVGVSELTTALVWMDSGRQIEGTAGACDLVFDPERKAIIVSEDAADVLYERVGSVIATELRYDGHDLKDYVSALVAILRVSPEQVESHLTKLRVPQVPEDGADASHQDVSEKVDDYLDQSLGWREELDMASDVARADAVAVSEAHQPDVAMADAETERAASLATSDLQQVAKVEDQTQGSESLTPSHSNVIGAERESPTDAYSQDSTPPTKSGGNTQPFAPARGLGSQTHSPNCQQTTRSDGFSPNRGRARTYVSHSVEEKAQEGEQRREHRTRVEKAAVRKVMELEVAEHRVPKEMPHLNEGYDIESYASDGKLDRYIEVKGLSGPWSELGVAVSRGEFRKAYTEAASFYLYVVEFALEPNRATVYSIQNPANTVDEFWFDNGWIEFARVVEGKPDRGELLTEGTVVIVDGAKRGVISNIDRRGALMHLEVTFGDGSKEKVVYSSRRIQIEEESKVNEAQA